MPTKRRFLGVGVIIVMLSIFICRTLYEYKIKTGTLQYSAFGGWQMAANALYGYAYTDSINIEKVPSEFKGLHDMVNRHMDSIRYLVNRPDKDPGVYYLWDFKSPLVRYLHKQEPNKKVKYFDKWAKMGPLYGKYGRWLIRQTPVSFTKHYAWPNLLKYYCPPTFFMGKYNLGIQTVDPIVVTWFKWKNNQLPNRSNDREIHIMSIFPNLLAIINPALIVIAIFFISFGGIKMSSQISKKIFGCLTFVWFTNTFFSVLSAPIELRYQIFPAIITLAFCILLLSWIIQSLIYEHKHQENSKISMKNSPTANN